MSTTSSNNYTGLYGGGTATVNPNTAYGNANVVSLLAAGTDGANTVGNIVAAGNISAQYYIGNGSQLTGVTSYTNANVTTLLANFGSNSISTTGNVTASYFAGDGSQLTNINAGNISGSYGNANVTSLLAGFGSNTISTTGNVSSGNINVSGGAYIGTVVSAAGNVRGGNINTAGQVSAGGNITGGNVSTTGVSATTITATGNITGGNVSTTDVSATTITATGNITGGNLLSSGTAYITNYKPNSGNAMVFDAIGNDTLSLSTANIYSDYLIVGNTYQANPSPWIAGPKASSSMRLFSGSPASPGSGIILDKTNNNATISTLTGGNIILDTNIISTTATVITASAANISANYYFGNGSQLSGITTTPGGSNGQVQYNNAGTLSGALGFTFDNTVSNIAMGQVTGNVNIANLVIAGAGNNIKNINPIVQTATPTQYRITVGTGYNGSFTNTYDPLSASRGAQLFVMSKFDIGNTDTNQSIRQIASTPYFDMQGGTINNTNRRIGSGAFATTIGNGTFTVPTGGTVTSLNGTAAAVLVGNVGGTGIANATVSHTTALNTAVLAGSGGTIGNAFGVLSGPQINSGGNMTNIIGFTTSMAGTTGFTTPTTAIAYYNPGSTATYGVTNGNGIRAATNYYFLKNDDPVAQNQMGSMRSYTEYDYTGLATSGSLTIDKNNGQVQQIDLTGNVTGLTFSNFVTSASDSVNTDYQVDTVTLIFNQGSTGGYGVSFPAASSTVKYGGNITALQSTAANSVSLVSISAAYIGGATTYLITISPGFV